MAITYNSESKVFIRNNWDKPLLKLIEKKTGNKLLYVGLPSPEAEDIDAWIEHLRVVIAFQCRKYGELSDPKQDRKDILKLHEKLLSYEREMKLENFIVYDGYIEEVVLRGYDNSPDASIDFELNEIVTVYNLDFCNNITSPIEFLDRNGNLKKAYKFNAIKELIQNQNNLATGSDKFVLFLTVQSSYKGGELEHFINPYKQTNKEINDLIAKYNKLDTETKNQKIVQLFVIDTLKSFFRTNNIIPHFLPTIFYNGLNDLGLLHFTVLGTANEANVGEAPWNQCIADLCSEKRITVLKEKFTLLTCEGIEFNDVQTQPVKAFSQSKTFSKLWI